MLALQFRRSRLISQTEDLVEVVFINAPHAASGPIPRDVLPYFEGPYYEWFTVESMGDKHSNGPIIRQVVALGGAPHTLHPWTHLRFSGSLRTL